MALKIVQLGDYIRDGITRCMVDCPKHPSHTISFEVTELDVLSAYDAMQFIEQAAFKALREKCSECVEENRVVLPPTRWPEGAEL